MKYDFNCCENVALIGVWMIIFGIISIFVFAIFAPNSHAAPFIVFPLILGGALVSCVGVCLMVNKYKIMESELIDYKKRLKDYLIDKFSSADEDKPSMISVAALLRNELLREIYNDINNDRI